jgi:hypothetical protein
VLYSGPVWRSRLYGLISLELGQHIAAIGVGPELLYRAETEATPGSVLPARRHSSDEM